ncbi:MAG: hypothetical protein NZ521_01185 [Flammeovirgaceae bacterium]|nr:hypothetical protein [Flammeovirgaceae bacterium]
MTNLGENSWRIIKNPVAADILRSELQPNEKLLWCAQPIKGRFLKKGIFYFFFGIPFTGFSIFWMTMTFTMTNEMAQGGEPFEKFFSLVFPLFGLPFVLVGLGLLTAPLWMEYFIAPRTVYAITTKRAILIERTMTGTEIYYYTPEKLKQDMYVRRSTHNTGDIILEKRVSGTSRGGTRITEHGFMGVENLTEVSQLLEKVANAS